MSPPPSTLTIRASRAPASVILEETDEGTFERGTATKKLVHQLSSTGDPVFNLKVPASRIVGGYTVKDGVIVPNFTHSEIIEAVFRRTRVTVGLMTAAKLLSAVEPVIRYQRSRFRGAEGARPGTIRYEQGIQQREDALHRLVDVWACGEAAASLGFAAARLFDELDPLEEQKITYPPRHAASPAAAPKSKPCANPNCAPSSFSAFAPTIRAAPNWNPTPSSTSR